MNKYLQIRSFEPENWNWNYQLFNVLRSNRLQQAGQFTEPVPEEKEFEAILNAVQYSVGTSYHGICIVGLVQSLAEFVRDITWKKISTGINIDIRTRLFNSTSAIMDYITEEVG